MATPWQHGPGPAGARPRPWTLHPEDPPPTAEEHRAFLAGLERLLVSLPAPPGDGPGPRLEGQFRGDRTETLRLDANSYAGRPEALVMLLRVLREFLSQEPYRCWRVLVPLDPGEGDGLLAVYGGGIFGRRVLGPEALEREVVRRVVRGAAQREGEDAAGRARLARARRALPAAIEELDDLAVPARLVAAEPGEAGYRLVWVLHHLERGETLDDLVIEPECGYQEVFAVTPDGALAPLDGEGPAPRALLVLWEVPEAARGLTVRARSAMVRLPLG